MQYTCDLFTIIQNCKSYLNELRQVAKSLGHDREKERLEDKTLEYQVSVSSNDYIVVMYIF